MKYLAILAASALAACASHNNPPAASADSVEQASSTPSTGASFAPAANDGTAAAQSDARVAPATTGATPTQQTAHEHDTSDDAPHGSGTANAAAMPSQKRDASEPDNSRVNARDRGDSTLTPMDQGPSEGDRTITQHIRQAVVKDGSLSFTAKNVKIITINGKVTLRGPVKTDAERTAIEAAAKKVAGVNQVDNFLEVKN